MQRAIKLANQAEHGVLPNPKVGAVLSYKGSIVGQGFHQGPGKIHAEADAILRAEKAGFKSFDKATLYVTLEPCCHEKKRTAPCVPLIVQKKIGRVVIGHRDPNPQVSGRGIRILKKAGISVEQGLEKKKCQAINQAYIKNHKFSESFVSLKMAMSFDGKLANDKSVSQWITGEKSRKIVHQLRAQADAIAIGSETINKDNPSLNVRLGRKKTKKKVVIYGPVKNLSKKRVFQVNGAENIIHLPAKKTSINKRHLKFLYQEHGICHLFVEGGAKLASSFLKAHLVDQLELFYGLGFLGGRGKYSIGRDWPALALRHAYPVAPEDLQLIGQDVYIRAISKTYTT